MGSVRPRSGWARDFVDRSDGDQADPEPAAPAVAEECMPPFSCNGSFAL